ncbi:MAG: RpiB/LacA/LacB family sugar-phosphate isomerase [Pyrinomonadaceae bacterium]
MPQESSETRERVRELVRQVLANTPVETESAPSAGPEHVVVNSLREKHEREFDRDESAKTLITEDDLRGLEDGSRLRVRKDAKFTPLASDLIGERKIKLIMKQERTAAIRVKNVAIGADHGGFAAKEELKQFLSKLDLNVRDYGTNSADAVDYPDYAHAVAKAVSDGSSDVGIVIDGAGIGSAIAANKVPNVRAAACYSEALAKNSREHNGANVITLGNGQNSVGEMQSIIEAFLTSELSEDRHKKRVGKIVNIEKQYNKW